MFTRLWHHRSAPFPPPQGLSSRRRLFRSTDRMIRFLTVGTTGAEASGTRSCERSVAVRSSDPKPSPMTLVHGVQSPIFSLTKPFGNRSS